MTNRLEKVKSGNRGSSQEWYCICLNADFANSADPDKMPPSAAFYLGLHCLQKYPFWGFPSAKSKNGSTCITLTF